MIAETLAQLREGLENVVGSYMGPFHTALTSGSEWTALWALLQVALVTLIPLTMVRNNYCFTIGYGASVGTMAITLALAFDVPVLEPFQLSDPPIKYMTQLAILYGIRLTLFLSFRRMRVSGMAEQTGDFDTKPTLKVLPIAVVCGVSNACMMSPLLFALRNPIDEASAMLNFVVEWFGLALATSGFVMETVADQHKMTTKQQHKISYGDKRFVGPTSGVFGLCRHPNYLGEDLFWTGLWVGCMPSYGTSISAWIVTTLGLYRILMIMKQSADRLDKKQEKWYGGQRDFETWKATVKGSLIPRMFVRNRTQSTLH